MNEKDKAKELVDKFYNSTNIRPDEAKQCAIICVDEILLNIEATIFYHKDSKSLPINKEYWLNVKSEIEKNI